MWPLTQKHTLTASYNLQQKSNIICHEQGPEVTSGQKNRSISTQILWKDHWFFGLRLMDSGQWLKIFHNTNKMSPTAHHNSNLWQNFLPACCTRQVGSQYATCQTQLSQNPPQICVSSTRHSHSEEGICITTVLINYLIHVNGAVFIYFSNLLIHHLIV